MSGAIQHGDAVLTTLIKDERPHGWRQFRAPKGKRFVMLLLGTTEKESSGSDIDVDAMLEELGWEFTKGGGNGE